MNKQLKIVPLLLFCFAAFFSCKKDEVKVTATEGTKPALTASSTALNYDITDSAKKAVDLSWTPSDYGYQAAVSYFLQFSYKDSAFKKYSEQAMGAKTSASFTVEDFNKLMLGLKYPSEVRDSVYVRVRSQITNDVFQYSAPVAIAATPYLAERVITYKHLFVPGAYQGWAIDALNIGKLYSVNSNSKYQGYINLPDAANEFKLTPAPKWDNSYGMVTNTGNAGTMAYNGGGNFTVNGAGYYLLKADTDANTWSATLNNWSIIGDGANGWDPGDDVMFDFDPGKQVLTKTLTLKVGEIKFRANKDWALNIGENGGYGAANIKIATPGTYKITLDLRVPEEPVYTIELQ